ncbi:hypothetical protein C8R44DRAFT_554520, partial [Mycena epipterygia]
GLALCPECGKELKPGPGGLMNLVLRHLGKPECLELKRKRDTAPRPNGSITSFFGKKVAPVPVTVRAPSLIKITSNAPPKTPAAITGKTSAAPALTRSSPASSTSPSALPSPSKRAALKPSPCVHLVELIGKLRAEARRLPISIPEADDTNPLAVFSGIPASYAPEKINADGLWEVLAPTFHAAFDYGAGPDTRERMVQTGPHGLGGFCRFLEYFVVERGLRGGMVQLKIEQVLEAVQTVLKKYDVLDPAPEYLPTDPNVIEIDSDVEVLPVPTVAEVPRLPSVNSVECAGFIYPLGTNYPLGLHDTMTLPWGYSYINGVLALRSYGCHRIAVKDGGNCRPCAELINEPMVQNILNRAEHGMDERMTYQYYSFAGLVELLRRKNQRLQELRFRGLNTARQLLSQAKSLSDYKRLVRAIGSGVAKNVDRLVRVALRRKRGVRAILWLYADAARGVYHPKDYTEEDDMRGILMWKMGGNRLADIAHRALGLPSRTTLRDRLIVPPIIPSPGIPQASEVAKNVEACFKSITDVLASKKVVHQIIMFDELATEKRIRWDHKTNNFLGVCRQHASKVSLQFNSDQDLEELFRSLAKTDTRDPEVHYAGEATVAAVGILSDDTRLYAARPVLISGDCKKESGSEHARNVVIPTINGVNDKRDLTRLRTVSIASDGESRRGTAFVERTFVRKLAPTSNIYDLLKDIPLMNLWVGDDDLTADKDHKHVFKRPRNRLLRKSGTEVLGVQITPSIIRTHLHVEGHSAQHIHALFNPEDKQDVKMAFMLLKDIWSLPPAGPEARPGFASAREALGILGSLFYHLVFPYICVDFSLSEQLEHLTAAAYITLLLYRDGKQKSLPTLLYTDIMIMIKNVFFCVAKAKVDDPTGRFWIILLGTDRLEQLFGILRTMIGNDTNLDILQLIERITGTTECANILAKYPHWDRPPRQLPDKADHIRPPSWRGDVAVANVTLLTCARRGRRRAEEACPSLAAAFRLLDEDVKANPEIDMLAPFGTLIMNVELDADDNEDDDDHEEQVPATTSLSTDLEDAVIEEEDTAETLTPTFTHFVTVGVKSVRKTRALALMQKYGHKAGSTDRLRRVADVGRYSTTSTAAEPVEADGFDSAFGAPCIMVSEPIVTLARCENKLFLCIGEVTDIRLDSESVEQLAVDILLEQAVTISFQILRLVPATPENDPTLKNDWVSSGLVRTVLTAPGRLVLPIDPPLSTRVIGKPCYLFESSVLCAFGARLLDLVTIHLNRSVPKV